MTRSTSQIISTIMDAKQAPMMLHEQVASGHFEDQDFTLIRDISGLKWQIRLGDKTIVFDLHDAIQQMIVSAVAPQTGGSK